MSETTRQSLILYAFINITLTFSLALPAAGMVNHLLPSGVPEIGRGLLLWLLFSVATLLLTLSLLPLIRKRVRQRIDAGKAATDIEMFRNDE
jgi:lysylphosphatidylglycerol synthetase-like protein (DUF2156 family)